MGIEFLFVMMKILEMDDGSGHTTLCMYLTPLDHAFKKGKFELYIHF